MATSTVIVVLFILGTAVALNLLLQGKTRSSIDRLIKSKRKHGQRAADKRVFTPQEQQIMKRSRSLAKQGRYRQASQLLEQMGLHREAISMLEDANLIDDAATMLMKMRLPNRAGVVYARHRHWSKAAACFKQAGLPIDAAKCLRECNQHGEAAELFLEAGKHDDAAACLAAAKNWQAAGRLYLKLGHKEKALKSYEALVSADDKSAHTFEPMELDFMQEAIEAGFSNANFLAQLSRSGRAMEMVRLFLEKGEIKKALQFYQQSPTDLGPLLMSEVNLQSKQAAHLAALFREADQHRYAGMVYEQMGDFSSAAQSFEHCNEFERASYCWNRAGDRNQAKLAAAKKGTAHPKIEGLSAVQNPKSSLQAGVFAIEANTTQAQQEPTVANDRVIFNTCVLFEGLDSQQLQKIWNVVTMEVVNPGTSIYAKSDKPRGIYIVMDGVVERRLATHEGSSWTLKPADSFGQNWVLAEQIDQGIYEAKSPCRLLFVDQAKFIGLLEQDGRMAYQVYKAFTARLLHDEHNPMKPKLNLVAS